MSVAFVGEPGSFSELAAKQYFGNRKKYIPRREFKDVYDAVHSGDAEFCVLPIENSLAGSVHENYDLLIKGDLLIVGEIYLKVSHFLLANKGISKKDVEKIYSHPQPLAQCRNYLSKFKDIEQISVSTTSAAVKLIKEEKMKNAAAIASLQAAIDYKMEILDKKIEDNHNNQTRFLILTKKAAKISSRSKKRIKTSVVFTLKNIPGALFKALSVFALRDIDLFKIESRPVTGKHFEYMFYLDFAGNAEDEAQKNAINHLREITSFERVLGSYYCGEVVEPDLKKRK